MPPAAPDSEIPNVNPASAPNDPAAIQVPLESAGGGQIREQQAQVGEQLGEHIGRVFQLEKLKADQASANDRVAAIVKTNTKYLYGDDNTPGFMDMKGYNAVKALNPTLENSDKELHEIINSSPDADVHRLVTLGYNQKRDEFNQAVRSQFMRENDRYQENALTGRLQAETQAAANGVVLANREQVIGEHLASGMSAIIHHGVISGDVMVGEDGQPARGDDGNIIPGFATQVRTQQYAENLHAAVIRSSLENDPDFAKKYFESSSVQAQLQKNPVIFKTLQTEVQSQVVRAHAPAEAMDFVHESLQDPTLTWTQARDKALQSVLQKVPPDGPDTWGKQKAVETKVRDIFDSLKQDKENQLKLFNQNTYAYIAEKKAIPPWMPYDQQMKWDRFLRDGAPKQSDFETLHSLRSMMFSQDSKTQNDFLNEDLTSYRDNLSSADLKALEQRQAQMKDPKSSLYSHDPDATQFRIQNEVGREAMIAMGWDPNAPANKSSWFGPDTKTREQSFTQELDNRVSEWKASNPNKTLGRNDVREITGQMVLDKVGRQTSVKAQFGGLPVVSSADEIPSGISDKVNGYLKERGVVINDANRKAMYNQLVRSGGDAQ